jgi:cytoskeletal protein CcmA (bactofilin family)
MFKSKAPEKDKDVAADAAEIVGRTVQQQQSVVEQPPPRREPTTNAATRSCIGSSMSIVGNIECNGPAQVFGRIEGEVRASDLLIGDGAQIEGTVIAGRHSLRSRQGHHPCRPRQTAERWRGRG